MTDRIVITSASHDGEIREADLVVRLHSGMAFGTAEHPTTRGCLRILEVLLQPGSRIADVGTGSGILAIAAALLGATTVIALEMDPLACAFAEQNVALNEVADRVQVRQGKVSSESLGALRPFDGILANLELAIVQPLLPALREALAPRGWLVVSGILRQEHATLLRSARSAGFELKGEERENGWWTGWFRAGEMGGPEDRKGQALPAEVLRQRGV